MGECMVAQQEFSWVAAEMGEFMVAPQKFGWVLGEMVSGILIHFGLFVFMTSCAIVVRMVSRNRIHHLGLDFPKPLNSSRGISPSFNVERSHRENPPRVEGKAWSEPQAPLADPPAELDKVVTSRRDPNDPYCGPDLLTKIFAAASLEEVLLKAPRLCKSLRDIIQSGVFREARAPIYLFEKNFLAPLVFYRLDVKLYPMGYDSSDTNSWIRMPPFPCPLSSNNIKSVAGDVGLLCGFVWSNGSGSHIVYNPLTQNQRELPPMRFPRMPCVTNLHVTAAENRYQVIAIGSQASGTHPRKTEIYDSKPNQWTDAAELPEGYLIDIQTGAYLEGYLYVIGSMGLYGPKVVMVLDLKNLNWLLPAIVLPSRMAFPTTVQLLQCNGAIYLFSQDVSVLEITHCIYRLNPGREGEYRWTKKVNDKFVKKEPFSRVEYTCVPLKGKQPGGKLGIFKNSCSVNAVTESVCRVYDITEDEAEVTVASQFLPCPPFASENAVLFHPENPVGYFFVPSFFVDA